MEHRIILWIVGGAALFYTFGYFASQKLIQAIDRKEAPESTERAFRHALRAGADRTPRQPRQRKASQQNIFDRRVGGNSRRDRGRQLRRIYLRFLVDHRVKAHHSPSAPASRHRRSWPRVADATGYAAATLR